MSGLLLVVGLNPIPVEMIWVVSNTSINARSALEQGTHTHAGPKTITNTLLHNCGLLRKSREMLCRPNDGQVGGRGDDLLNTMSDANQINHITDVSGSELHT